MMLTMRAALRIRLRMLLISVLLVAMAGCSALPAGLTGNTVRVVRIGILNVNNATEQTRLAFIQGMKDLGYDEDKGTAKIIWKGEANTTDPDKIKAKFDEILAEKPDILFVMNTAIAVAAAKLNTTIPIVFAAVYDPVASNVVANLVQPGKNVTGILHGISEAKRLEWFTRIAPNAKRYYVPYNPKDPSAVQSLGDIKVAAGKLGITIIERPCISDLTKNCTADNVINLFNNVPDDADAIMCPADPTIVGQIKKITEVSYARKLPVSVIGHPDVENGALFSYGFNFKKIGPQAARIADQILKGVSPGQIPVETAELDLYINLVTAQKIGLQIPLEVLNSASVIIRTAPGQPTATPPQSGTLPATPTRASTSVATSAATSVATVTATVTATVPATTPAPSATSSPTTTATASSTATATTAPTNTATSTSSATATNTATSTATNTQTSTATNTTTSTASATSTATSSPSPSPVAGATQAVTQAAPDTQP